MKPRLAIVSSHNICCALAYYADAIKEFLTPDFDVEIIDLKTSLLLRKEGEHFRNLSEDHIEQMCLKLQEFDVVNIHMELGLYGTTTEEITSRIIKLCKASKRLILTVHTIDYKGPDRGHSLVYQQIMNSLKKRPLTNPFHLIAHLPEEANLLQQHFKFNHISHFPLIFLTDERRKFFLKKRGNPLWKKQFGLSDEDITIGMFGLLSKHKNYLHALKTIHILPKQYKLLIIGEAHHMSIQEMQIDPVISEMVAFLDLYPSLRDQVIFTGKRDDAKYYEDLANIDFVLLPSFEVGQSGSATLSNALELSCAILKSNTYNSREYEKYYPECFEVFDIGNYYETKQKILHFDRSKIEKLKQTTQLYSETQFRTMYVNIYQSMKECIPIDLPYKKQEEKKNESSTQILKKSRLIRTLFNLMPTPVQTSLRKIKRKYF